MKNKQSIKTQELTLASLLLALLMVSAYLVIPIQPVPISLQTLIVLMIGLILPAPLAALTCLIYIVIGLADMPIFAGGLGGLASVIKPSFGFVISFLPAAYLGARLNFSLGTTLKGTISNCCLMTLVIYLIGLAYMYFNLVYLQELSMTVTKILQLGLLPFIPGDTCKIIAASLIYQRLSGRLSNKFHK